MEHDFLTILNSPTAQIIRKRSVFKGFLVYANNKFFVEEFVHKIRSSHSIATHCVVAYSFFLNKLAYCTDDGEPSKTAGEPVLNVIRKKNIFDVCVVVLRYFGGTKLGTGGLVEAYSSCCKALFDEAVFAKCCLCHELKINVDYGSYEKLRRLISDFAAKVVDVSFELNILVKCFVEETKFGSFKGALLDKFGKNIDFHVLKSDWHRLELSDSELEKFKSKGK